MPRRAATSSAVAPPPSHKRALSRRQMRASRSCRRRFSIFCRRLASSSKDIAHALNVAIGHMVTTCIVGTFIPAAVYLDEKANEEWGIKDEPSARLILKEINGYT